MQNVEFKAELKDLSLARAILRALGAQPVATLEQTDTYYRVADPKPKSGDQTATWVGRLKKRETVGEPAEWIFCEREDRTQAKISRFKIYNEQEGSESFGAAGLEVRAVVRKKRELFILDHVRVHLDTVEGLGTFLEFEALVSPRQSVAKCHEALARLRAELRPALGEAIAVGYADMVEARS